MRHRMERKLGKERPNHLRGVRWRRHRTVDALLDVIFAGADRGEHEKARRAMRRDFVKAGMHAMAVRFGTVEGPPIEEVHYWHDGKRDPLELAFMLGHEAGHLSGRPYMSRRNAKREEDRADHYGHVVAAVMTVLARLR